MKIFVTVLFFIISFGIHNSCGKFFENRGNFSNTSKTSQSDSSQEKTNDQSSKVEEDFLSQAKEMNSEFYQNPPVKFREGHITPKKFDSQNGFQTTKNGYQIQLPNKTQIPTPTICNDVLYLSGGFHSKDFYAFDAKTGKNLWSVALDDDGPSTAACTQEIVIFNTESCTIFAIDAKTGKHLWSHWLGDPLTSTPTIAGNLVFTSYPSNQFVPKNETQKKEQLYASHVLVAFELSTGKILWQKWIDSDVMSSPVAEKDGLLYVTTFSGTIYSFKQSDGSILSAQKTRATSAPVVTGKDVFYSKRSDTTADKGAFESVTSVGKNLKSKRYESSKKQAKYLDKDIQSKSEYFQAAKDMDASNGFTGGAPSSSNPKAAIDNIGYGSVSSMQAFQGSRILHINKQNINTMGDEITATDSMDGKKLWSAKLDGDLERSGGNLASPPAYAGGQIFVSTLAGKILEIQPNTGKITKEYDIGTPLRFQPVIYKGNIYVTTQDGKLFAIHTNNPNYSGWTTWGGNSARTNLPE
ncbi:MAG: PQQ-binding-like beta-propeller repeat protein [Leptospiraceae bacterium]|nr:PQQ-binding-like beta-propeller repeat protein [Leptospiraceae bacterium]MCP5496972.1 PQQ-binding-like beta-propeller repeat protein [Leptospiraceae bacterium]